MNTDKNEEFCSNHPDTKLGNMRCTSCHKLLCRKCISDFGYFCSTSCRSAVAGKIDPVESRMQEREYREFYEKSKLMARLLIAGVCFFLFMLVAMYFMNLNYGTGTTAWSSLTENPSSALPVFLSGDEATIKVIVGDKLIDLSTEDGRIISEKTVDISLPETSYFTKTVLKGDKVILQGYSFFRVFNKDGTLVFSNESERIGKTYAVDESGKALWYVRSPSYEEMVKKLQKTGVTPSVKALHRVDLESGSDTEAAKIPAQHFIKSVACNTNSVFLLFGERSTMDVMLRESVQEETCALVCFDAAGRSLSKLKLKGRGLNLVSVSGDAVVISGSDKVIAVHTAGEAKWEAETAELQVCRQVQDTLLLVDNNGSRLCDPLNGKVLWATPVVLTGSFAELVGEKLIASIRVNMDIPDNPLNSNLNTMKETIAEVAGEKAAEELTSAEHLAAFDSTTGHVIWQTQRPIIGMPLATSGRLFLIRDTAKYQSGFQAMTGGERSTLIVQFNPETGERLYEKWLEMGFDPHIVSGKRLIGTGWEPVKQQGAMSAIYNGPDVDWKPAEPLGIFAVRIK